MRAQVCVWNATNGQLLHRLRGHTDVAYDTAWCDAEGLLASCSHDGTVRTWRHDPHVALSADDALSDLW